MCKKSTTTSHPKYADLSSTMIICDIDFIVDICWPKFVSMSQGRIGFSFAKETGDLLAAHLSAVKWPDTVVTSVVWSQDHVPLWLCIFPLGPSCMGTLQPPGIASTEKARDGDLVGLSASMLDVGVDPKVWQFMVKMGEAWRCWSYQRHCHWMGNIC